MMPTPYWQPYRAEFASRILVTASPVICALAPPMTRIPKSCSAQPPFPRSGPSMVRPLIVAWTPLAPDHHEGLRREQVRRWRTGAATRLGRGHRVAGAEIVAPALAGQRDRLGDDDRPRERGGPAQVNGVAAG